MTMFGNAVFLTVILLTALLLWEPVKDQPSIAKSLITIVENYAKPLPIPAKCR